MTLPPDTVSLFAAYLEQHGSWGPLWPAFAASLSPEGLDRLGDDAARAGDHHAQILASLLANMTPEQRAEVAERAASGDH